MPSWHREKELLGGECDYWARVPGKALLRPVVAIADARATKVRGRPSRGRSTHLPCSHAVTASYFIGTTKMPPW